MSVADKVQSRHCDRLAIVYVRQSTLQQVERHQESTRLQYGLVERALQFGWSRERVVVIDDDLGRSGAAAAMNPGFQRLVAEVGLGRVGLSGARCRDVPPGTIVPGLAPASRDLRRVRHAPCRHGWRV